MKILGLDIETAPHTVYAWGLFKQNINLQQIIETGRVMCFAWKWYDTENEDVGFSAEWADGSITARRHLTMVKKAHSLLTEADVVLHFNGERFDLPTLNKEFIEAGLGPPAPYQQIDLLKVARRHYRFASNKLDHLLQELGIGEKVRHSGFEMWVDCMNGVAAAQAEMETYNREDVAQMELLYERMLPWIDTHPNHALYNDALEPQCPTCGSTSLQKRGFQYAKTQKYQRFCCNDCGAWSRDRFTAVPRHRTRNTLTQAAL
jgi:hypothetical protein